MTTQEKIDIVDQLNYHVSSLVSLSFIKKRSARKHAAEIRKLVDRLLIDSEPIHHYPPEKPNIPPDEPIYEPDIEEPINEG